MRANVLAPVVTALVGCFAPSESGVVAARAAHDFHCSEDDVSVENISGGSWEAKGCGHKATYDCVGSARMDVGYTCAPE